MKSRSSSRKTSFIPRSILRTIGKIRQAFDPQAESKLVEEFRAAQQRALISIRFLLILIVVPVLVSQLSRNFVISPLIKALWNKEEVVSFLNSSQEEKALAELKKFEQAMYFESRLSKTSRLSAENLQKKLKEKAISLTKKYKNESFDAVINVFGDLLSVFTFVTIVMASKQQLNIIKSLLDDIIYGLSDSAKAFLIILSTDLFVGFHSPYGWQIILEGALKRFGLSENKDFIFLFIATIPVIADTIFKYWIFRYLNRSSPSAVATYHNMNE
ncbi:CemA family protein [cyanobacterium TDX16]|nr:CemA family protein [cyanobacterium TDX16]